MVEIIVYESVANPCSVVDITAIKTLRWPRLHGYNGIVSKLAATRERFRVVILFEC
jgi:hypothetical protein